MRAEFVVNGKDWNKHLLALIPLVCYFGLKYGGRLGEGQSDSPYLIYIL